MPGAIKCTLDRVLEPKDSCQRKTIQRRAQTNDKQTAAEFYKREREREREREALPATTPASKDTPNKKRNGTMVLPATTQASKDTPGREGVYLSVASRNTPKKAKKGEGRGKGEERGLRPLTGSNEP